MARFFAVLSAQPRQPAEVVKVRLSRLRRILDFWAERRRQRRALLALDDHLLHDIGVSRSAALRESTKPFWR